MRMSILIMLLVLCGSLTGDTVSPAAKEHTQWVAGVLAAAEQLHPGMSRSDIMKQFEPDGGTSTIEQQTYVFQQCPYIKIDVTFVTPLHDSTHRGEDKILTISKPYLEKPRAD